MPTGVFDRGPGSKWALAQAARKGKPRGQYRTKGHDHGTLQAMVKRGNARLEQVPRKPYTPPAPDDRAVDQGYDPVGRARTDIPRGCVEVSPFYFGWRRVSS
jgi:hypothetical protein